MKRHGENFDSLWHTVEWCLAVSPTTKFEAMAVAAEQASLSCSNSIYARSVARNPGLPNQNSQLRSIQALSEPLQKPRVGKERQPTTEYFDWQQVPPSPIRRDARNNE
jgi:hypothetical protein